MSKKLVNLDFLDREAQLYRNSKDSIKQNSQDIRKIVDEETLGLGLSERSGLDILFGNVPETGVVLDAEKESVRLKKLKKNSKSILSGASPSYDINEQKKIDIK